MRLIILAMTIAFLWPLAAWAQENPKARYDSEYLAMVARAHTMPEDFNFKALRKLYPKTSFYSPFGEMSYKDKLIENLEKAKQGDKAALAEANKIADEHFAHFRVHFYMMAAHLSKAVPGDAGFNDWALKGIAKSMLDGNDGSFPPAAIKVLDVSEEYFLVRLYFRGKPMGQSVLNKDGRIFDVLAYTDTAGNKKEAYFDIGIPFSAYPTELKK